MKISEKIQALLETIVPDVEKAIIDGDFIKMSEDRHTVKIEVIDEIVSIWNVENQTAHVYRIELEAGENILCKNGTLEKPDLCRQILREPSATELASIDKQIAELKARKNKVIQKEI